MENNLQFLWSLCDSKFVERPVGVDEKPSPTIAVAASAVFLAEIAVIKPIRIYLDTFCMWKNLLNIEGGCELSRQIYQPYPNAVNARCEVVA